jgi:hypothetical protein
VTTFLWTAIWVLAALTFFDASPLPPLPSLFVLAALYLAYFRFAQRDIDAAITKQYTENTTPEAN